VEWRAKEKNGQSILGSQSPWDDLRRDLREGGRSVIPLFTETLHSSMNEKRSAPKTRKKTGAVLQCRGSGAWKGGKNEYETTECNFAKESGERDPKDLPADNRTRAGAAHRRTLSLHEKGRKRGERQSVPKKKHSKSPGIGRVLQERIPEKLRGSAATI